MATVNNALGYILIDGAEGLFRGASLVVDHRGIPMDFRYTDPIKPSRLERILYGSALDVYLREELVLESLLKAVEVSPALWFCKEPDLMLPLKKIAKARVVFVAPSNRPPLEAAGSVEPSGEGGVYMIQADSVSAPLRAAFPENTREDEVKSTAAAMVEAARTMELFEPFGRIVKALTSLGEE